MQQLQILALVLGLAAFFTWVNARLLRLQPTIGLMFCALVASATMLVLDRWGLDVQLDATLRLVRQIDFSETVLHGMLCFLLFGGAVHVQIRSFEEHAGIIAALAIAATLIATAVTGLTLWAALSFTPFAIPLVVALLFGAIISPTDPIAALAILSSLGLSKRIETVIDGESLFNDGIGVVLVTILTGILIGESDASATVALQLFVREVFGGMLLGMLVAGIAHLLLGGVERHAANVLMTLATVTGGYAVAELIEVSGPIATVVTGMLVGNFTLPRTMDADARRELDSFWDTLSEILNAVLFLLIGFQMLIVPLHTSSALLAVLAIPAVLLARWLSLLVPITVWTIHDRCRAERGPLVRLLTWAGLRGGLSVALALSLPESEYRDPLIVATYAVVAFSILVQGTTVGRLYHREFGSEATDRG
ncbi:MAG: cation:proton antiporter [Maioricimonas sp. JB049]